MAGQTTNYLFDYPTSTDYVKDGATAIQTLADDVDAAMFSALKGKKAGMVLLQTQTPTAAGSVTFDNVFSATYRHYSLILDCTTTASTAIALQLRTSGLSTIATNYANQRLVAGGTSVSAARNTTVASFTMLGTLSTTATSVRTNIYSPFLAQATQFDQNGIWTSDGTQIEYVPYVGAHTLATSYAGIILTTGSGTMTGSVSLYGWNI